MTIRESIRSQWATMKDRPLKEKFEYFWHYYGTWTVCGVIAIIAACSMIIAIATQKESGFCGVFFGVNTTDTSQQFLSDFADATQIDPEQYEYNIQLYPNIPLDQVITEDAYYAMQGFSALVASNSVEVIGADEELFIHFAYLSYMTDLRAVLTTQQLDVLSEHLYYIDKDLLKAMENAEFGEDVTGGKYPDPKDPKSMGDPVPVGIALNVSTAAFRDNYRFVSKSPVIGICGSSHQTDNAKQFLYYIFEGLKEE